ncbi:hypothetical protein JTB14_018611 [Gonioctena quinquepunctata]|nr:hypothetical protein JTB14_018611 [Gonioctena quinquepunctata]
MGSDISKREKSKKSTVRSSVRKLKIQAHEKLDKIEQGKEKIMLQRLKRMQQKIMLGLELKNTLISDESESNEEKSNIIFDEVDNQFKYNQIQTWIDNESYENFENCEKGEEARQTEVDSKKKPNRFEERLSTRQNTPKPGEKQEKLKSAENQFLEKIITRQSLNRDLPYFSVNPLEWQNFITQFQETTELCQFSDRVKMSRLQKCLKGKAKETVHTLLHFPNKLKDVLQLLERRFGRKEDIIEQIFTQLKHTKQVREENLENLVELSNTLQNMTVCLESLNCEEYLINPQILRELIDKMPLNLRMNWGIHVKSQQKKVVSIKDFSLWLEEFTQTISYMQLSTDKKDRKQKNILTTNSYEKSRFCSFCEKSDHYQLIICEEFEKADVASRWKFVVDKNLCFCCLFGNHKISYCKKKQLYNINGCKSKHNTLLHKPDNISQNSHENKLCILMILLSIRIYEVSSQRGYVP